MPSQLVTGLSIHDFRRKTLGFLRRSPEATAVEQAVQATLVADKEAVVGK